MYLFLCPGCQTINPCAHPCDQSLETGFYASNARSMSLSLNWKNLSSRLDTSKVNKPLKKKSKKYVSKQPLQERSQVRGKVPDDIISSSSSPKSKLMNPVERALWETESGSELKIDVHSSNRIVLLNSKKKMLAGKYIAIDCEFVGVGKDERSALARVSLVNYYGVVLLDTFVKPKERVTDWRTWVSGVTPQHMRQAITFEMAQKRVHDLLNDKILVGHAVQNDLESLLMSHPRHMIRDTSRFSEFRKLSKGKAPGLKKLAREYFQIDIQTGAHSSVDDAQVTMALFRIRMRAIEKEQLGKAFT